MRPTIAMESVTRHTVPQWTIVPIKPFQGSDLLTSYCRPELSKRSYAPESVQSACLVPHVLIVCGSRWT